MGPLSPDEEVAPTGSFPELESCLGIQGGGRRVIMFH